MSLGAPALAQGSDGPETAWQPAEPVMTVDGAPFSSWHDYTHSDLFQQKGLRCGIVAGPVNAPLRDGPPSDCSYSQTNPSLDYHPLVAKYGIPVVVHIIRSDDGSQGDISEAMVQSQIDILNEDFLAIAGTNGEYGTDVQIEFYLASQDPNGDPTTGITYSNDTAWFNDNGGYWNSLAWDTNRYLNIYTNRASGALGYVPNLPQGGIVGRSEDRVVILWSSFGRNGPIGSPYDQGRTTTHEVGHYLGLQHPFSGGCASPSACYTNGDLICDTNPESSPTWGCYDSNSCDSPDPIHNYLDYSDDLCMEEFTWEQTLRLRCTLENYRPDLYETLDSAQCGNGIVEPNELCDKAIPSGNPGACPTDCTAGDPCDGGTLLNGGTCRAECQYVTITDPVNGDGCCPDGANAINDNDCAPACGNGVCEAGETTANCPADCECSGDGDCHDNFVCTIDVCLDGACSHTLTSYPYGDVNQDDTISLFDLFCILNGFSGDFSICSLKDDDLHPCQGDGAVTVFDLFAVLNAFGGLDPCCGG